MTEPTTYTLTDANGTVEYRGLTVLEAARAILDEQGYAYELRFDAEHDVAGEHLYGLVSATRFSRELMPCFSGKRSLVAYAASEALAWPLIAEMVIHAGWPHHLQVITDADYDAMIAEAE